jgi:D-glycero-D-manno-heptose 1,7-bisphosphate phosphatase
MKQLLVDLDGTIREPLSGSDSARHPRDFKIIPGADKALAYYHREGWLITGITNQAGVAAGFKSLEDCVEEQRYTFELFPQLSSILFCPDFEGRKCYRCQPDGQWFDVSSQYPDLVGSYRKPGPGMLQLALAIYQANPSNCWMIGDRPEDEKAADAAGVNFMAADVWRERFRKGKYDTAN